MVWDKVIALRRPARRMRDVWWARQQQAFHPVTHFDRATQARLQGLLRHHPRSSSGSNERGISQIAGAAPTGHFAVRSNKPMQRNGSPRQGYRH
jgi:hypothetical protein